MRRWISWMGSIVAVGFAAGCGDDATAPNVVIDPAQARVAGNAVADQASNLVDAFTLAGLDAAPVAKAVALAPVEPRLRRLVLASLAAAGAPCAAFSDTSDSDGDGVPNDLTVTFASPACTTMSDSGTAILTGSLRVSDPGTSAGFDIAYSNVRVRFDRATNEDYLDLRLNGTQGVSTTTGSATLGENLTLTVGARLGAEVTNVTLQSNWSATFSAAQGQSYAVRAPLPDGTITLNGSTGWTAGTTSATFALTTVSPLVYDDACIEEPLFGSGELRALVVGNRGGAFVRVRFVGCGQQPVVVLVAGP